MVARLTIKTLGGLSLQIDERPVKQLASRKAEALLVYLGAAARSVPREVLAELLWDDRTQRQAMSNLRVVLSSLRKQLGPYLHITRYEAGFDPDANFWLDSAHLDQSMALLGDPAQKFARADIELLAEALTLYEGDFLAGFFVPDASSFDSWVATERERLHWLAGDGLRWLAAWYLDQGENMTAVNLALRLVNLDPLEEVGHRLLMQAFTLNGQRAEALRQYDRCRQLLQTELGIPPSAETNALREAIRGGKVPAREGLPAAPDNGRSRPPNRQPPTAAARAADVAAPKAPPPWPAQPFETPPAPLPAGIITFLFTDIVDSTELWEKDPAGMRLALKQHDDLLEGVVAAHSGHHFKTIGDEFQVAFTSPQAAITAAIEGQRALLAARWPVNHGLRVRMGLHLGHVEVDGLDYAANPTLNRLARIVRAAHGGQILLSGDMARLVSPSLPESVTLLDLGRHQLKGLSELEHLHQVRAPALPDNFPQPQTMGSAIRLGGRYERREQIGHGTMGTVYRGLDTETGKPVAIKALRPEAVLQSPNALKRFWREGEILRRLNHPNIVSMLDMLTINDQHFLVLEYVGGGNLRQLLAAAHPLPLDRIVNLALDLADALTRAHRLNIIHRDLKPTNVLLTEDGAPRLSEFGVAHIGDQSVLTRSGLMLGTLAYVSPEIIQGLKPDERADIWSFGVLLYEMVANQRPFDGRSVGSLLVNIINQPVPDIAAHRPGAPPALQTLLQSMLTRNRDDRIASMRQVAAALETVLDRP